MKKTINTGT